MIKSFSKSLLLRYIKAQAFSMWDSLLFNLDSLAGFYQGFIVCGEKSRVAKGDKLSRREGGGGGGPGACSPKNLLNEYASKCYLVHFETQF